MNLNSKLIPVRLAIQYTPPSLALIYRLHPRDKKKRRYHIQLNQLAYLPDPTQITDQLYQEHSEYLNDSFVEYQQVHRLVKMLFDHMQQQRKSLIRNLDEVNSYIQSDDELNKSIVFENEDHQSSTYKTPYKSKQTTIPSNQKGDSLTLSMSGMQQFMQSQNPTSKFQPPLKPAKAQHNNQNRLPTNNLPDLPILGQNDMGFIENDMEIDNIGPFDQQLQRAPRNSRYIEDIIDQNQSSYYMRNTKNIPLPEPLLARNKKNY